MDSASWVKALTSMWRAPSILPASHSYGRRTSINSASPASIAAMATCGSISVSVAVSSATPSA
jgi:hypothetical protein